MTALEVRDLVAGYEPGLPILRGASVSVLEREIVVLLGPNGAGKSTLVKAIAGLVPVSSGGVLLAGQPILGVPAHRLARAGLGFVPQTDNMFTSLSVRENLALAAAVLPARERRDAIGRMTELFPDLARLAHRRAGLLSGGQRQMLAIARALVTGPKVLMLDEPSAGLSPLLVGQVLARLRDVATHAAVLLVEQNVSAALAVADRGYVLVEGRVAHEAAASVLREDPVVAALYLGRRAA